MILDPKYRYGCLHIFCECILEPICYTCGKESHFNVKVKFMFVHSVIDLSVLPDSGMSSRPLGSRQPTPGACSCLCCCSVMGWWRSPVHTGMPRDTVTCSSRPTSRRPNWWRRRPTRRKTWRMSWRWARDNDRLAKQYNISLHCF